MLKFYKAKATFFEVAKSYSFPIFLYDKNRNLRIVALLEQVELTDEVMQEWNNFENKGAYLQIHIDDLDDFIAQTNTSKEQVHAENEFYLRMHKLQDTRLEAYKSLSEQDFLIKSVVSNVSKTSNYLPLIERVKAEVLCFPLHESQAVSLCTELVEKLFSRDILPVRSAAFAYIICKQNKITDVEQLSNVIIASLIKDAGFGLIPTNLFGNIQEMNSSSLYLKHPMLSLYILSKLNVDFSKEIKRLILEQHEQYDGSGFPRNKKDNHIDFLSYIVNLSDQILMYGAGKINGKNISLEKSIEIFYKRISVEGINISFPENLLDSLGSFLTIKD